MQIKSHSEVGRTIYYLDLGLIDFHQGVFGPKLTNGMLSEVLHEIVLYPTQDKLSLSTIFKEHFKKSLTTFSILLSQFLSITGCELLLVLQSWNHVMMLIGRVCVPNIVNT